MNEKIEQNAINPNNEIGNKVDNATNTFNLIIGIATLLIAILGATFAYFSATARSKENDVTVKSAFVSINYEGGTEIKATNLIPATQNVALKKYQKEKYAIDPKTGLSVIQPYDEERDGPIIPDTEYDTYKNDVNRKCVDAKGREVCYVYQFSIISEGPAGEETDIIASIKVNENQFDNLSYVLYEVDFKEDEAGNILRDKYNFGIVEVTEETNGYQYVPSLNFQYTDTFEDNYDFTDIKFDKFKKPDFVYGENFEVEETIYPVACLFGYTADADSKRDDDTSRCATYGIENKIKHTYQLVIWLEETGIEQPEQGLTFAGTVTIEVSGGFDSGDYSDGHISGTE